MNAQLREIDMARNWIVLRTITGKEKAAADTLGELGYATFCPETYPDLRRHPKKRQRRERGLVASFPGYSFAYVEFEVDDLRPLKEHPNVIGIVTFGDTIPTVPEEIMDSLLAGVVQCKHEYEPGERVRLSRDRWEGYEGVIVAIKNARGQQKAVRLLLDNLQVPVDAETSDIEPVN